MHSFLRKKRVTLKLISPKKENADKEMENFDWKFHSTITGQERYSVDAGALSVIAGLTPKWADIIIQDENIEDIDFDEKVDLVAITANTALVERAYKIADEFRKKDIKVIIGGMHTSIFPCEGLLHADSIAVGEVENIWKQIIEDFKSNNLKKIYQFAERPILSLQPMPRHDLINHKKYRLYNVQVARGCPYNCEFCSVQTYLGNKYRCKSIGRIIKEIKILNSFGKKSFLFSDDNFFIDEKFKKEFLKAIIPLKISFSTQIGIHVYQDEEFLDLLVRAGCTSVLIGFESINQKNLEQIKKDGIYKVDHYYRVIEKIQSKGIMVTGSFLFGFDSDDINVFEDTAKFIKDSGLGNFLISILTPLPGTELYSRLEKEDRLLHKNWTDYDLQHVCFKPKRMTVEDLQNGYYWIQQELFDLNTIYSRSMKLFDLWNKNKVRLHKRLSPLITNLAGHNSAYFYSKAKHPSR